MNTKAPLVVLAVVFASWAQSATYYVDCNASGDGGAGTSTTTAWRTINRVNVFSFSPGDSILFNRGCTWREQLTVPSSGAAGKPITFGAYGSGANPIIKGTDLMTGWVLDSGNVWKKTGVTADVRIVVCDGTIGNMMASKSLCTVDLDYYYDAAGTTLYLYSATDPDTRFTNPGVEVGQRNYGIRILDRQYITIQNLTVDGANHSAVSVEQSGTTSDITVDGCTLINSGRGYWQRGNTAKIRDTTIQNCTVYHNPGDGIGFMSHGGPSTVRKNAVYDNAWNFNVVSPDWPLTGIHIVSTTTRSEQANMTVEYNLVYNNGMHTVGGASPGGIEQRGGIILDTVKDGIVRYNVSHNNYLWGIQVENSETCELYYNISYRNGGDGISIYRENQGNKVYNNVSYANLYGIVVGRGNRTVGGVVNNIIKNNIALGSETAFAQLQARDGGENDGTKGSGNVYEYNCFGAEAMNIIQWGQTNYSTYAAWETAYGGRAYSVESDPKLTNAAGGDFTLQATSPCIDAGADLGPAHSTALMPGSSWPSNVLTGDQYTTGESWEIGAYLFTGGGSPPGTPTPTPTPTPTRTPTPTPTPTTPPTATGTLFYPLTPCRVLDTRTPSGTPILGVGERRIFTVAGTCGVPSGAKAIVSNLTVVGAAAQGELKVIGGHLTATTTSSISFPPSRAKANNAIVQLATDGSGTISVINNSTGTVHFILDVSGYFQ